MAPEFYDLCNDPREYKGNRLPMYPIKSMFTMMKTWHPLRKEKYSDQYQNR